MTASLISNQILYNVPDVSVSITLTLISDSEAVSNGTSQSARCFCYHVEVHPLNGGVVENLHSCHSQLSHIVSVYPYGLVYAGTVATYTVHTPTHVHVAVQCTSWDGSRAWCTVCCPTIQYARGTERSTAAPLQVVCVVCV